MRAVNESGPSSPHNVVHPSGPVSVEEPLERRVDPADGRAYTKNEFIMFYGSNMQWDSAKSCGTTIELNVDEIRHELRTQSTETPLAHREVSGDEEEYEILEEEIVLSEEWAHHFCRSGGAVAKGHKEKSRGAKKGKKAKGDEALSVGKTNPTAKKRSSGGARAEAGQGQEGSQSMAKSMESVARWKSVRYTDEQLGLVRQLEREIRNCNGKDTHWKVYPEVPMAP